MEENKKVIFAGAAVICLIALAVIVYFLFFAGKSPVPPSELNEQGLQSETTSGPDTSDLKSEPVEALELPLEGSDAAVRDLIMGLSADPVLSQWILGKELIRRFTAAVDNIAQGLSPRPHINFFKTNKEFSVEWKSGRAYIDSASFSRYNAVAEVFSSLDEEKTVTLLRRMKPVLQEAYGELGYPDKDFGQTLMRAMDEILGVPVPSDEMEVELDVVTYTFVDPNLEKLSNAQKHVLRMGPDNIRIIQSKLKKMAEIMKAGQN